MHSTLAAVFSCFCTAWFVSDNHSLTWISLVLDSIVSIHSGLLVFSTIITPSCSITLFSISTNFVKVIADAVSFPILNPWWLRLVWKSIFSESRLVLPLLLMYLELLWLCLSTLWVINWSEFLKKSISLLKQSKSSSTYSLLSNSIFFPLIYWQLKMS